MRGRATLCGSGKLETSTATAAIGTIHHVGSVVEADRAWVRPNATRTPTAMTTPTATCQSSPSTKSNQNRPKPSNCRHSSSAPARSLRVGSASPVVGGAAQLDPPDPRITSRPIACVPGVLRVIVAISWTRTRHRRHRFAVFHGQFHRQSNSVLGAWARAPVGCSPIRSVRRLSALNAIRPSSVTIWTAGTRHAKVIDLANARPEFQRCSNTQSRPSSALTSQTRFLTLCRRGGIER